jgi:hypothetical protein
MKDLPNSSVERGVMRSLLDSVYNSIFGLVKVVKMVKPRLVIEKRCRGSVGRARTALGGYLPLAGKRGLVIK